jgi:CRP-like cAMP-binding protein
MKAATLDDVQRGKIESILGECALFRALKPEHYPAILSAAEVAHFQADEVVVQEGDPSDGFFVVVEGQAAIRVKDPAGEPVEIGRMPLPVSFGEMGLLLNEPRTASVVALTDMVLLKFSSKAFDEMFRKIPNFGVGVSQGLAYRLHQLSGRIPLPDYDMRKGRPRSEVVGMLPAEFQQRHRVVPLEVDGNVLTLGTVDDPASQTVSAVRKLLPSLELKLERIDTAFFHDVLSGHAGVEGWSGARPALATPPASAAPTPRSPQLDTMLERMVAEGASDLHLPAGHKPHWRIDGDMREIGDSPALTASEALELLEPVMEKRHREQFAEEGDADFAYSLNGGARFRINIFRGRGGVGAVLRQIPSQILTLDQLGMPPVLKNFCDYPKGWCW